MQTFCHGIVHITFKLFRFTLLLLNMLHVHKLVQNTLLNVSLRVFNQTFKPQFNNVFHKNLFKLSKRLIEFSKTKIYIWQLKAKNDCVTHWKKFEAENVFFNIPHPSQPTRIILFFEFRSMNVFPMRWEHRASSQKIYPFHQFFFVFIFIYFLLWGTL